MVCILTLSSFCSLLISASLSLSSCWTRALLASISACNNKQYHRSVQNPSLLPVLNSHAVVEVEIALQPAARLWKYFGSTHRNNRGNHYHWSHFIIVTGSYSQCLQFSLLPINLSILLLDLTQFCLHICLQPSSVLLNSQNMQSLPLHTVEYSFPYSQCLYFSQLPVELKSPLSKFCALSLNLTILLLELAVHLLNLTILLLNLGILSHLQSVYMECNYTFKVFEGASSS